MQVLARNHANREPLAGHDNAASGNRLGGSFSTHADLRQGRVERSLGRLSCHLVRGLVVLILGVTLHPPELHPASRGFDGLHEIFPEIRVENRRTGPCVPSGLGPLEYRLRDVVADVHRIGVNDDSLSSFAQAATPGLVKRDQAGLQLHLVVRSTLVARVAGIADLLVADLVNEDESNADAARSWRAEGRSIRVDIQRVLDKHPSHSGSWRLI